MLDLLTWSPFSLFSPCTCKTLPKFQPMHMYTYKTINHLISVEPLLILMIPKHSCYVLLIKLNKYFRMSMNIPMKLFTNEPLKWVSIDQIRSPNKEIRILQQTLQFWSFSSKFKEGDSNPYSRKCRLTKAIRIPPIAIRIHISESAD